MMVVSYADRPRLLAAFRVVLPALASGMLIDHQRERDQRPTCAGHDQRAKPRSWPTSAATIAAATVPPRKPAKARYQNARPIRAPPDMRTGPHSRKGDRRDRRGQSKIAPTISHA